MDLRSLIDKLDTIEQTQLLTESEELMERVGLRLQDIEQAVGRELDADKRASIIGGFARKFGYAGLFDPVSGKFVNKDGKFASFGAYQSEVEQLEDEGLIPNSAKTDALLGFMGKDEKKAKPSAYARADLFGAIDKADGLLDKALDGISESSSISNSLLKEFGINTQLLEAITPEEHQFLKKTVKDAEPIKHKADANNLITRYTKEYVPARNRLIKQIQTVIAAIKPAKPAAAPAQGERSGGTATVKENVDLEMLREMSLTPQGKKAGAKLYEPSITGYLSPDQVKHNLALLKKGHAKLDWSDHVGKTVKDWANMATFDLADMTAAAASSAFDPNTTYAKEREKQKAIDQAYNQDPNALNLRTAANAAGYKLDANNPVGNMTIGDVLGLVGPSGVTAVFNAGKNVATKLGGNALAKFAGGTTAVVGTSLGLNQLDDLAVANSQSNTPVKPQPAAKFDKNIKAFQEEVFKIDKKAFPKFGRDGKMGGEVRAAIAKYPEIAKKYGLVQADATTASDDRSGEVNNSAVATQAAPRADTALASAEAPRADTVVASANDGKEGEDLAKLRANAGLPQSANDGKEGEAQAVQVAAAPAGDDEGEGADDEGDQEIDTNQVKTALAKVGVTGKEITSDQLLALAAEFGITDGAEVSSAGTSGGSTSGGSSGSGASSFMGQYPSSKTATASSDGGLTQGTTATAESLELTRILALSGLTEDYDIDEGRVDGGMKFASWVIDQMIASGPRGQRLAKLANEPVASKVASPGELRAARKLAKEIEARGPARAPAAPVASADANAASRVATALNPADDAAKAIVGKTPQELQAMANNQSLTALQRSVARKELERLGIKVGDDAAGKTVANAEKSGANVVANAEKVGAKVGDDAVAKLTADAAKGEGLLYKVGFLGGRFVRLLKNPRFLALLAALSALGVALYVATRDKPEPGPNGPEVVPQPVVPGPDGRCPDGYKLSPDKKTCVKDTGPGPGPDPKEEERKRQLSELEALLAKLYGGWPTDPETAETIKAGVAAGAKAPEGFKEGGVSPQPAGGGGNADLRANSIFGGNAAGATTGGMIQSADAAMQNVK